MKKVAIITITNSGLNFGNRLQNYALQEMLKKYGVQPETIISANVCMNSLFMSKLRRILKGIVKNTNRRRCFNAFSRKYITASKNIHYGKLNDTSFSEKYSAFIVGSDQVWNHNFHFNSDFEFLTFTQENKRYSFAASFGVDDIPIDVEEKYREWLCRMRKISVREFSGREIVKKLTGREPMVHLDPTMLLTQEDYIKIEERPFQRLPNRYLLMYYLGEKSEEKRSYIFELAKVQQLEILELSESKDTPFYHIGPQHFLYLFRNADYICTDSFHGTAMAIIFEKRFTVFCRQDNDEPMNDRIYTLLDKMNLSERLYDKLTVEESIKEIDYEVVNKLLEKERLEAENYLEEISHLW